MIKKRVLFLMADWVFVFAIGAQASLCGADFTWTNTGMTNNLGTAANWDVATIPGIFDSCRFGSTYFGDSHTPQFNRGAFGISQMTFADATPYTFSFTNCIYALYGLGIVNTSSGAQTFNFGTGSIAYFNLSGEAGNHTISINGQDGANFNWGNTVSLGGIYYSLDGGSRADFLGGLEASESTITVSNSSVIYWKGNSNGGNATVTSSRGSLFFSDSASAGNATFNLSNTSEIIFSQEATAENATVNLSNGCCLAFNDKASGGRANVNLTSNSSLVFGATITNTIGSINSASTASVTLQSVALTIGNNTPSVISSPISQIGPTPSSLNKMGSAPLTLKNTTTYTGGTTISEGQLTLMTAGNLVATSSLTMQKGTTFDFSGITSPSLTIGDLSGGDATTTIKFGSKNFLVGTSRNTSFGGSMQGSGSFTKQGTGTLTLTGTNTYSGGTFIAAGTLIGNEASLKNTITINPGTNLIVDLSMNAPFTATLLGSGNFIWQNNGTLNFTANCPDFTGITTVSEGKMALNASLGGEVAIVGSGVLSGAGTVIGHLILRDGGTLAPGNSIGTLHVIGDYVQEAGTYYQVEINERGESSLIDVMGTATLNGGQIVVTPNPGVYNLAQTYTILNVTGGVTGTYAGASAHDSNGDAVLFSPRLFYDTHHAYFNLHTAIINAASSFNQHQVATLLDAMTNPTRDQVTLLETFMNLTPNAGSISLDQCSGEQYTSAYFSSEFINRNFIRQLYDPLRSLVTTQPACPSSCERESNWQTWLEGGAGRSFVSNTQSASGFHSSDYQISLGIQKRFSQEWTLGGALSEAFNRFHYNLSGSGQGNTFLTGLYGLYRPTDFYILTNGVYGFSCNTMQRPIQVGLLNYTAHSKPKMSQYSFYGEAGKDLLFRKVLFQPFIGLEVAAFHHNRITEEGADLLNLVILKKERTMMNTSLGAHSTLTSSRYKCNLSLDMAWLCHVANNKNRLTEHFSTFGNDFVIKGVPSPRNGFEGALTFNKEFLDIWNFYTEFSGEKWKHTSSYNFSIGLGSCW